MSTTAKTQIRFRRGVDNVTLVSKLARENRLLSRFAVIQDSYRPDKIDMFFDELLWRRLIAYAKQFSERATVEIMNEAPTDKRGFLNRLFHRQSEIIGGLPVNEFLERWAMLTPDDREPPALIIVREHGIPVLCISTEYWTRVGGPREYADSYTYSVFSRDPREEIGQFIASATESTSWNIVSAA